MTHDTVFTLADGEWRVRLNGRVLPTIWNSRGAALAGLEVERRRQAINNPGEADEHREHDDPQRRVDQV